MTVVGEERRLFECGDYSRAASDRANTVGVAKNNPSRQLSDEVFHVCPACMLVIV